MKSGHSRIGIGLRRKALRLQELRRMASEQVIDAELAYEDLTRQCKEAWENYNKTLKRHGRRTA